MAINFNEINTNTFELIQLKLKDVLLNALYETVFMYTSLNEDFSSPENYTTPENIINQQNKLKELIIELPAQLKLSADERSVYIKRLIDYRAGLIDDFYSLNLYLYRLQQIKDLYTNQAKYASIDFEVNNVNEEAFLSYVDQLTAEVEKLEEQGPFMMGELMALFPLRMTKVKYSDYITKGLAILLEGLNGGFLENTVKMFKAKVNPLACAEYGKHMTYIKEALEEFSACDLTTLDVEALENALTDIDGTEESIGYTLNTYSLLYNIVVYITALCQFCVNEEHIFENDLKLKDMLYATIEMLKADEPDMYAESLEETIGDMIEEVFEATSPKEKKLEKALEKMSRLKEGEVPEDTVVTVNVYTSLMRTFVVEIIDELSGVNNEEENNLTIDEAVKDIVEFVENSLSDFPLPQQKLIKQRLLGDMPSPLNGKESYEYMSYAFGGISDVKKKLVCIGNVLETTDPEEPHHHDHKCGCGHDHHHDHECGCGHDHHHECDCGHHH